MEKPAVGEPHLFVKVVDGAIWFTTFRLYIDDSCGFLIPAPEVGPDMFMHYGFKFRPDGWRRALRRLADLGFLEVGEAKRKGLVPAEWKPPRREYGIVSPVP